MKVFFSAPLTPIQCRVPSICEASYALVLLGFSMAERIQGRNLSLVISRCMSFDGCLTEDQDYILYFCFRYHPIHATLDRTDRPLIAHRDKLIFANNYCPRAYQREPNTFQSDC
jgi:hypothetical protein